MKEDKEVIGKSHNKNNSEWIVRNELPKRIKVEEVWKNNGLEIDYNIEVTKENIEEVKKLVNRLKENRYRL